MTPPKLGLSRLIGPLRDQSIGGILEALARELESEADVIPEPELRDDAGNVMRGGVLNLPSRGDLEVIRDGHTRLRRVESDAVPGGKTVVVLTGDGFEAEFLPFHWDAAELTVFTNQERPGWGPLRRWFLEWFQSRYSEVAPDLHGVIHSLDGPRQVPGGWAFTIDFGSAPIACVVDLISAVAKSGARRMRVSQK